MPHATGPSGFDAVARKGLALAERRLLDLSELYRSGLWTHYYASQAQFATQMLQAIKVAKIWARLAGARRLDSRKDDVRPAA